MNEAVIMKEKKTKYTLISIASVAAFLTIWYLITDVFRMFPSSTFPSPVKVAQAFVKKLTVTTPDGGALGTHLASSLQVALYGYLLGVVIGVPLGILMGWYRKVDLIVKPIFDLIRPIPPVGWIPLMILWLGIGMEAKATVIFVSAVTPSIINAYTGIKQTSSVHIWVARTFGAGNFQTLIKVGIPSALPMIFAGLKVSLGASWMALVAAEMLASTEGLGYMIQMNRMVGRADNIMVGMITIGLVGALLTFLLETLEKVLVKGGRNK